MIPLGSWIVALHKCLAKVDPPGWPGIAALRTSRAGSRRATATQTLSARATLCVVKTTVLLLEERTPTGGWTAVCLQASPCRSQNQKPVLNQKLVLNQRLSGSQRQLQRRSQQLSQNLQQSRKQPKMQTQVRSQNLLQSSIPRHPPDEMTTGTWDPGMIGNP